MKKTFTVSTGPMLVEIGKDQLDNAIAVLRYLGGTLSDNEGRIIQRWKPNKALKPSQKVFI